MTNPNLTTVYQETYTWPKIMPVKVFNSDYNTKCTKKLPIKKIDFDPTKEFTSPVSCKGTENPQLVFLNVCEAKSVNFVNMSCSHAKPEQKKCSKTSSNNLSFNVKPRPMTANPSCPEQKYPTVCAMPNVTVYVNHVGSCKEERRMQEMTSKCPTKTPLTTKNAHKPQPKICKKLEPPTEKAEYRPNVAELLRDAIFPCSVLGCKDKKDKNEIHPNRTMDHALFPESFESGHFDTSYQASFGKQEMM